MHCHSKHPFPTSQEKTLHMDITRWPTLKSDWLYSLQPKMEKLYTVSKNKTGSWLWLRSWTPYCQIQTQIEERKLSLKPNCARTLISNFQPPELWEINICCLSHPVYGISFGNPSRLRQSSKAFPPSFSRTVLSIFMPSTGEAVILVQQESSQVTADWFPMDEYLPLFPTIPWLIGSGTGTWSRLNQLEFSQALENSQWGSNYPVTEAESVKLGNTGGHFSTMLIMTPIQGRVDIRTKESWHYGFCL